MTHVAYWKALFAWIAVYAVLLYGSVRLQEAGLPAWLVVPDALLPMIGGFGVLRVSMRRYRSMDELERRMQSESIVFAFGWAAVLTFSYGFLETSARAPVVSFFWVWPVMASGWIVGKALARRRYH